jgi:hypothetical protein
MHTILGPNEGTVMSPGRWTNGGVLLLREAKRKHGVCLRLTEAIPDRRDPDRIRRAMFQMVMSRVLAITCGHEDAIDLDRLRHDPLMKLAAGRCPESGDPYRRACVDHRSSHLRSCQGKARYWIDDIASGCVRSFAEIAEREGKVERHIRLLTPLAFISRHRLAAIIDGTGPHNATVTALAQALPYWWDRTV